MPCIEYGSTFVCFTGMNLRQATGCPVCEIADAPVVVNWPSNPYYGPDSTCTVCGDSWADGYLRGRPFRRGWRLEAIAEAVALWELACECPLTRDDDLYILPCDCNEGA